MGTSGTRSGGLRKGQSPCEFLGGLSGFLSLRCRGLRPCVDSGPEPEDSSPVLTWNLGTSGVSPVESVLVSNAGMHLRFPPERRRQCHAVRRVEQRIYGFPSSLSHEAFPRGFRTVLSHVHTWWESILGLNFKAVQGKQVPLEWTDTFGDSWNGGTTLEFLSPFLWRAPPLEMRRERREIFPYETGKGSLISS
ncbi:hypothetical protein MJT46_005710 [Ovis ammon polii x Ovis aries]|nr:hypothetical protein MJT46_005710 [Ovis ammon polii x Ovis aries]